MALSLSAEQRSILQIFSGEEIFCIPDYQRMYSWEYDDCYLLYNDLMAAFSDCQRDYFVGNIVMARYDRPKYERQIVDGQQRLTTIWIILKVLSVLCDTINPLFDALSVKAREGGDLNIKINSCNDQDKQELEKIFAFTLIDFENYLRKRDTSDGQLNFKKSDSLILQSAIYFYKWFKYFREKSNLPHLKDFANYLLDDVYLLPIELYDANRVEAENKALTIFETINNRGKDLANADIFKSRLYDRALFVHEQDKFTVYWKEFIIQCRQLNIEVDEVFRLYSHVIRGKLGITQMEIKLRDFFVGNVDAPLYSKLYEDVMNDLFRIIDVLTYIKGQKILKTSECGKWFQVIDAYSNNYPFISVVVFLFVYGFDDEQLIVRFTKSVIRYAYSYGSSRSVKFGIYNIIANVARRLPFDDFFKNGFVDFDFASAGRIKEGFAMIAYYQENKIVPNISIDKWISAKDYDSLTNEWKNSKAREYLDSIGNYFIIDVSKVSAPLENRIKKYKDSKLPEYLWLSSYGKNMSLSNFEIREKAKRKSVENFFKGK